MNQTGTPWNEADVHAYVDGELDPALAARLEADCRHDAVLAARIERQRRLQMQLRRDFDPVLEEPVPDRLLQSIAAPARADVRPIAAARPPRPARPPLWWGALAASLVVGAMLGWMAPRDAGLPVAAGRGGLLAKGFLETALSRQLSTDDPAASGVRVMLSFRSTDGTWCRSFALQSGADGLACRTAAGWRVEVIGRQLQPAAGGEDGYRQAGSPFSAALQQAIGDRQSGDPLSADEERALSEKQWRADIVPAP